MCNDLRIAGGVVHRGAWRSTPTGVTLDLGQPYSPCRGLKLTELRLVLRPAKTVCTWA
jgi:hypothetical protein